MGLKEYIPVLTMMGAGLIVGVVALAISHFIGPKIPGRMKNLPFECGLVTTSPQQQRVSVRFYLVAILFLLFDIEVIFFFPWAVVYKKYLSINAFILIEMLVFVGILLVGYFYVLKKKALEWE